MKKSFAVYTCLSTTFSKRNYFSTMDHFSPNTVQDQVFQNVAEAVAYLLQKPSLARQTVCQNLEDFVADGIPICYNPILYVQAMKMIHCPSTQEE